MHLNLYLSGFGKRWIASVAALAAVVVGLAGATGSRYLAASLGEVLQYTSETFTVTASRTLEGSSPQLAVDSRPETLWNSGSVEPAELTLTYGSSVAASGYSITCAAHTGTMYGNVKLYDASDNLLAEAAFDGCEDGARVDVNLGQTVSARKILVSVNSRDG
jgi:hypothetical protein